jgi:transcriptional regulator with XRE-family HTH domain
VQNGQLRAQRKLRGWSQEDLVRELVALGIELGERQLGVSRSLISRWECGVTHPRAPYPKLLCRVFNASAEKLGLVPPSSLASTSITMDGTTIEDGGDDVERRDFLRVACTAAVGGLLAPGLLRRAGAAHPLSLLDGALPLEAALSITDHYRLVLDSYPANDLMAPLLGHLQFVSQLLDSSPSRTTQIQLATAASEAAGFVSRLALDLNDEDGGWRYHQIAVAYAEQAENRVLQAYHFTGMSLQVGIQHDGKLAVQLVDRANDLVPPKASPGLQAWFAAREASAYSRLGDQPAALHALDRADGLASRSDTGDSPWPWTHPFGHGGLDGYRGAIAARLKLPEMALPALQAALGTQNPGQVGKYRALVLGDLAMSHLPAGELEESVRLTAEAFDIGSQLGSYRVLQRVREVRSYLNPYRHVDAVRDLDERMAGVGSDGS